MQASVLPIFYEHNYCIHSLSIHIIFDCKKERMTIVFEKVKAALIAHWNYE